MASSRDWEDEEVNHSLALRKAITMLRNYLYRKEASILKSWFKHFDTNMNGIIEKSEFIESISRMSYPGNPVEFWNELELADAETISLREISEELAVLWGRFRKFCGVTFLGPKDLLVRIADRKDDDERRKSATLVRLAVGANGTSPLMGPLVVDATQWCEGLRRCGWTAGHEEILFEALDRYDEALLGQRNFHWLESEVRRHTLKCEAKQKAAVDQKLRLAARRNRQKTLVDFKEYLIRHFGEPYFAWRRALDVDGTMNLQRAELYKVCRSLGWRGDVRLLWQAMDADSAGTCSLQELDLRTARQLARFRGWAEGKFGPKPAHPLWKAVDRRGKMRLGHESFLQQLKRLQVSLTELEMEEISHWLDWQEKGAVSLDDLLFLDIWKPPAYLTAISNPASADEFRRLLKEKYGHPLRGWRLMDKDNSNTCNWFEFLTASKKLGFDDAAGAWLDLDKDFSGAISLAEIDATANQMLVELKRWADQEFGGVRAAFRVLDKDKSGELTVKEFRIAVSMFGFTGDEITLFRCLDADGQGRLQLHEVSFLDEWDLGQDLDQVGASTVPAYERSASRMSRLSGKTTMSTARGASSRQTGSQEESMVEFFTEGPGPGTYTLPSTFGAPSRMPTARHGGAFSFCRRPEAAWLGKLKSVGPPPTSADEPRKRPPSWSFGRSPQRAPVKERSPGPGYYEQAPSQKGPKFTFGTRRRARQGDEKSLLYTC
ncbi:unnamed protein product [Durusdinium trenchii]|uniref:EF-hand domain-containing protein n=1 Tax=Durusdinium trenchii TaxID=1381693 RepID=A0ABP0KGJ0_9DINO